MEGGRSGEAAAAAAAGGDGPAPVFTLEEVAKRNSSREAWLVIHGRVYDVTRFLEEVRPGVGAEGSGERLGGRVRPGAAGGSGAALGRVRGCPGDGDPGLRGRRRGRAGPAGVRGVPVSPGRLPGRLCGLWAASCPRFCR